MSRSGDPFEPSSQLQVGITKDSDIKISGRAPTNIGPQGSHTSAYHLIEMLIQSISKFSGLEEATTRIFSFLSDLKGTVELDLSSVESFLEDPRNIKANQDEIIQYQKQLILRNKELVSILDSTKAKIKKLTEELKLNIKTSSEIKKLVIIGAKSQDEKVDEEGKITNIEFLCAEIDRNFLKNHSTIVIEELIAVYLTVRNKIPYTAFPSEGNLEPVANEGVIIKTSCQKLAKINHDLLSSGNKVFSDIELNKLAKGISQNILNVFWHPRIPDGNLINLSDRAEKAVWDQIVKKKYLSGTSPRNNDLNILSEVASNHIDLVLSCFPGIGNNEKLAQSTIREFIKLVAQNGVISKQSVGWGLDDATTEQMTDNIVKRLYVTGSFQNSGTPSTGSALSSGKPSGEATPDDKDSTVKLAVGSDSLSINLALGKMTINDFDFPSDSENDLTFTPPTSDEDTAKNQSVVSRVSKNKDEKDQDDDTDNDTLRFGK